MPTFNIVIKANNDDKGVNFEDSKRNLNLNLNNNHEQNRNIIRVKETQTGQYKILRGSYWLNLLLEM
jgi:hypothetical protein